MNKYLIWLYDKYEERLFDVVIEASSRDSAERDALLMFEDSIMLSSEEIDT